MPKESTAMRWMRAIEAAAPEGWSAGAFVEHRDRLARGDRGEITEAARYCRMRESAIVDMMGRQTETSRVFCALTCVYELALAAVDVAPTDAPPAKAGP